jgi:preprotein translocase subunit SecA
VKKTISSAGRLRLPYEEFLNEVGQLDYGNAASGELQKCIREETELPRRFAMIKEIIRRQKGLCLFDTQLSAARSLLEGRIAELPTGEGKTLSAVVAAVSRALDGHRVHILVFNDYLAKRDWTDNRDIYKACGVTAGFADQHSTTRQRKEAYGCDVTYVSAKQAGFDYLRDFMAQEPDELVFPEFDAAIVDEADSIMIDECTTPLVLAGEMPRAQDLIKEIDACVRKLAADEYELSHPEHQIWLNEKGVGHMEELLGLAIYDEENIQALAGVQNALEAHFLLEGDRDYIVRDGTVQLVEATTGRVVRNKRYPDLLHRAVEVKEGLEPAPLTMIYNTITMQDFLQLYGTLCGMTGTAATSAKELEAIYGLTVDIIPPHTPSVRIDHEDVIVSGEEAFYRSVAAQIRDCHNRKQPALIGTKSVAESELLSKLLDRESIPHAILNAKNDEEEAALIAQAGSPARVTISTNMAGRGVDIRLGGANEQLREEAVNAGGLFVVGVGINASERIDNQLRGRAGRQGDPGESKFFVCLDDADLSCRMTPLEKVRAEIGNTKRKRNAVRRVQRAMEGEAADARYTLGRYSGVVEVQRARLSQVRRAVLNGTEYFGCLEMEDPARYDAVLPAAGTDGIKRAERQLALFFINRHWAECLETVNTVRSSVHFMIMGQRNPLDEYNRIVIGLCDQMLDNIKRDITEQMKTLPITSRGVDMEKSGLSGGTTVRTYAVDESLTQFNVLHRVVKSTRERISGENGILTKYYRKKRDRSICNERSAEKGAGR